jgi:tetratricopeptide (TPR) repeat protein
MDKNRHLISRYLEGELNPSEVTRFEEALIKDPELQEELDLFRDVDVALADTDVLSLRAQLDELHEELTPQFEKRSSKKTSKRVLRYAVAASVAVIISLGTYGIFFKKVSNNKIVSQFYKPYDVTLVNRSANIDITDILSQALYKYENAEYADAVELFQQVLVVNPKMTASNLYSGISYFELKEYENARSSLVKVIEHNDNLYIEQARWYLGFCYIMLDDKAKARQQFLQLANKDGYYRDESERILRKINGKIKK